MSTKIYNGFRFKQPNLMVIYNQLLTFQDVVKKASARHAQTLAAELATSVFDGRCVGRPVPWDKNCDAPPIAEAWAHIQQENREIEQTKIRNPSYDFHCEVTVIPASRRTTLGIYWCEMRNLARLFCEQPWFIDYHYQNQADRPKNITAREWKKRQKAWDEAIGDHPPALRGFTMTLLDRFSLYSAVAGDVMPFVPTWKTRVAAVSIEEGFREWTTQQMTSPGAVWFEYRHYLQTDEGKKHEKWVAKEVRAKLKRRLTGKDLYGDYK